MKQPLRVRIALMCALMVPLGALGLTARRSVADDPAKIVTEADNGGAVTLNAGEVLVVRLKENGSTGYSRALVSFPDMPISLESHEVLAPAPATVGGAPLVGASRVHEWKFVVEEETKFGRTVWLKFLNLRPFAKGVETAGLWEVKVTVPATTEP